MSSNATGTQAALGPGGARPFSRRRALHGVRVLLLYLLLVSAALDAAISVQRASFIRLGTVAGLRVALTLLVSFELAFRTDTASDPGESRWPRPLRRPAPARPATRLVAADRAAENLWPDRARLGRHG